MATRIATADGNFLTAGTWAEVDATSLADSESQNTALTTSYVESATFTPGAITIDGIAVKVATRAAVPTGTISVRLAQAGATVTGTEVTINVSDIADQNGAQGWYLFKFASPVLLLAATLYTVSARTSSATQVNLFRATAAAGNWARLLRTTTTGAPGAGDNLFVLGEWTAAATKTNRAVTMDETATTDYGGASTTLASFGIGNGGLVTWGTTAATAYRLRWSGIVAIWRGGEMTMGTTGTPMPRDSSALLEFDCAADGNFGLQIYGTFTAQGLSRTVGKNVVFALLNTDEAAAQTVLGVDTDTGWLNADDIAIASTTRTESQAETRVVSGSATATEVTVTVGLTNAHSGTSPTQAMVLLLTRNVRIEAVTAGQTAYVYCGVQSVVDCDWTSFRYLGSSTTGKRGIEIDTTTGSANFAFCSLRNFDAHGIFAANAAWNNLTITDYVGYEVPNTGTNAAIHLGETTTSPLTCTLNNIWIIQPNTSSGGAGLRMNTLKATVSNVRICANVGVDIGIQNVAQTGAMTNFNIHACPGNGLRITGGTGGGAGMLRIDNLTIWRCGRVSSAGGALLCDVHDFRVNTGLFFGNTTTNINTTNASSLTVVRLRNCTIAGDTTFATVTGVFCNGTVPFAEYTFENCQLGVASGIFVAHTSNDIDPGVPGANAPHTVDITLNNTVLGSTTEIANKATLPGRSTIRFQRADGVTAIHRVERPALGTVSRETTTFRTLAPSVKMEPTGATALFPLESKVGVGDVGQLVPVASGLTRTVSIWVRKNAAYNGTQPRLMAAANPAIGIDDDTQLDIMTVGVDTWEELTATLPAAEEDGNYHIYVDCNGTAGAIFLDDFDAT